MSEFALTEEQIRVIERVEGEFVVVASAGSGKTTVLCERYLNLVENHGATPSQILTITFTKKAAAEMKRRIVNRLRSVERFSDAQEAETGPIQTLHSFYERVLRENSPAAGLDPKFEVVSGGESARLTRECVRKAISYSEEERDETTLVLRQLAGKSEFGGGGSYDALVKLIETVLRHFRDSGHPRVMLQKLYRTPEDFLRETNEELRQILPPAIRPPVGETDWHRAAWDDAKKMKLSGELGWLKAKLSLADQREGARLTVGLAQLALTAWALLDEAHRKANQLDFSALESRCVRLLEMNSDVRDRLNRQYRHVMVDESQDLNPNQTRLVGALQPESKMLVGDNKQSIYLFRNAVGDFGRGLKEANVLHLTKSHRSETPIQEFVDTIFSARMSGAYQAMTGVLNRGLDDDVWEPNPVHTQILQLSGKDAWQDIASVVASLHLEGNPLNDIAILTKSHDKGRAVARYLRRAGIGVREGAGKSNYYAKLEVRDVCNTLTALAEPENRFALIACLRSPVCELSLDAIVQLAKSDDPILGDQELSDEDQEKMSRFKSWFFPLRARVDRLPAWEVISEIMAESDLLINLATRTERRKRIENVRKLLVMAASKPELSALEYAEMIKDIESLSDTEADPSIVDSDEDLVTTTTIHAAKGLEWPIVIIPDADSHSAGRVNAPVFDHETGWLGYWQRSSGTYVGEYLKSKQKAELQAELVRLQYVAFTRAKRKLILAEFPGNKSDLFDNIRTSIGSEGYRSILRSPQV